MQNKLFWPTILKCENAASFAVKIEAFAFLLVFALRVAVVQARHCEPDVFSFIFIICSTRALVELLAHCHSSKNIVRSI